MLLIGALTSCVSSRMTSQVAYSAVADSARHAPPADARIPYGTAPQQFAELRVPAGGKLHPVVMLIHGGCWLAEYDLAHVAGIAEALRQDGIATWTVEYRRAGDEGAGAPGTFDDIRAAYDSLISHSTAHALDPKRIVLVGHSAGGHLALWLAAERGVKVRGTVGLAAITDLASYARPTGCGAGITRLLGGSPTDRAEIYSAYSPVVRPEPATPVALVIGSEDHTVPRMQAETYVARFPKTRIVGAHGGHFDVVAPWTDAWKAAAGAIHQMLR